jgi:signal transduction histidine kinase
MLVVALVGVAVCWAVWRMRIAAIDAELRGRIARVAASVRPGSGGAFDLELPADAIAFFQQAGTSAYYAVWSPDGTPVDRSDPRIGRGVPMPGARTHRGYREVVQAADGFTILIGRNIDDLRGELWSLATTMGAAGAGALGLAVLCAWIVAGRALAPVQRIGETAQRMARGELTARIPVEQTESELGQLASALNLAFDRLHETIDRQRRLTADASHELRTPVAMLSAEVEWALMRARSAGEYREALDTCSRVAARMRALVDGLLTLARTDREALPLRRDLVRLDEIVEDAAAALAPVARDRQITISADTAEVRVRGDADRLAQLFANLVYNAVAYNVPGGQVRIEVSADGGDVVARITDTGIGIDGDDLPRVFDRFYRGRDARTRQPGGAGLGLAVAKSVTEAHGGTIACRSACGAGTEMTVRLPAVSVPDDEEVIPRPRAET